MLWFQDSETKNVMKFKGREQWETAVDQMSKGSDDMKAIMMILPCISKASFCKKAHNFVPLCIVHLFSWWWKIIRFILISVYFHSYPQVFWLFLFAVSLTAMNFFIEQYLEIALTFHFLQMHRVLLSMSSSTWSSKFPFTMFAASHFTCLNSC